MADLHEFPLVREHVEFLINTARKQARDDVGHDPEGAVASLNLAIVELQAEVADLTTEYGL